MQVLNDIIKILAPYGGFLLVIFYVASILIAFMIIKVILRKAKKALQDREKLTKDNLKNINVKRLSKALHGRLLRVILAADGIDPNPLDYLTIMDGGHPKYVRTYTVVGKPKRTTFAKTFTNLFDFPGCTSSVFIDPISEDEMSRKLDNNITILSAEYDQAANDPNRRRKLAGQAGEANSWASQIENGDNKAYRVGFLFSLYADSISDLNKICDSFYAEALAKNIIVSNCFGLQAEAYALNGPYNGQINILSKYVKESPINYVTMDKYSVSTLINYLQSGFSHKSGVPLGRDMITGNPVIFDLFDDSHDSMSIAVAGKPGSGKSVLIKVMSGRQLLFGWHYVAIDSQERKGTSEGEYAALAIAAGGINFQIANNAKERLNLFDVSETIRSEKIAEDTYKEIRTLDLSSKITTLTNNICSMILNAADKSFDSIHEGTYVRRVITDTALQTYHDFGIKDGDVDSLYENRTATYNGITTSMQRKKLPTISDFYKRILINANRNTDENLKKAYTLIIFGLKDRIKELYYTKDTVHFLTRTEYENAPLAENGIRYFDNNGKKEEIIAVRGVKAYYDGQSTIAINRDCPFVNIDISQLPDDEKTLARQIAIAWVTENFIKKNSERKDSKEKLVVVLDEVHECYRDPFARNTIDITVREARKRYVGIILCTQTLKEYDNYTETQAILKLVECKFIFKQDYQDRDYLISCLGITSSQADMIVSTLGGSERSSDEDRKRHRGEMCIIDNKKVCFCKVDYLKKTEGLIADTNAAEVEQMLKGA